MPYCTIQTLYDAIFPKGRDRCYWKSTYLKNLDDGVIGVDDVRANLADLCLERHKGRDAPDEITLFKSIGASIEDLAAAILVWKRSGGRV